MNLIFKIICRLQQVQPAYNDKIDNLLADYYSYCKLMQSSQKNANVKVLDVILNNVLKF